MEVSISHVGLWKILVEILSKTCSSSSIRISGKSKHSYQSQEVGKKVLDQVALDKGIHTLMAFWEPTAQELVIAKARSNEGN